MSDGGFGRARVETLEPELLHQVEHLFVVAVDELAAELGRQAVGEQVRRREHAAAGAVGALEDRGGQARLLELVGGVQSGHAGADDGDARRSCAPVGSARSRRRAGGGASDRAQPAAIAAAAVAADAPQEPPPRHAPSRPARRAAAAAGPLARGHGRDAKRAAQGVKERATRHRYLRTLAEKITHEGTKVLNGRTFDGFMPSMCFMWLLMRSRLTSSAARAAR